MAHETDAAQNKEGSIKLFEDRSIRAVWDADEEEWYFSVVDVVGALTESTDFLTARKYWNKVKERLANEGSELVTNCHQLKMPAADGKMRKTDAATVEQLLRIIQSIPSKKAEPFKRWLAQVGAERIDETIDPERAINRAMETYLKKGYSEGWIRQRLLAIDIRKELTNEWRTRGVSQGREYAILTDEITRAWSGMSTRQYKYLKGLTKESLRDNMSNTELVLNMLAETSTTDISRVEQPEGFEESREVARRGGAVAGEARRALEAQTGQPVVTSMRAVDFAKVIAGVVEAVSDKRQGESEV
ncbi:MAG: Bro-N domain-containing protein [Eggerthellaceae bacterium]|nr:Bro-N domain-containing protein [Eggerthellaceae bacterium]